MCDGLARIRAERGQTFGLARTSRNWSGWRGRARTKTGWRGQFKMCFSDRRGLLNLLFTQSRNNLILFSIADYFKYFRHDHGLFKVV